MCKSECAKAAKEAEKAANPKVPKELAQLQKLQKEMVAALEREQDMLLEPLLERKQTVQDELSEIILEHGVGSAEFMDASTRLSEAATNVKTAEQKKKKLLAELAAKHVAQTAEHNASPVAARRAQQACAGADACPRPKGRQGAAPRAGAAGGRPGRCGGGSGSCCARAYGGDGRLPR